MKNPIKIYATIRLLGLSLMGIVYAAQGYEDFNDEVTNHRHIMVMPPHLSEDECRNLSPERSSSPPSETQTRHPLRVLSLGGGGTRGIGSAEILCVLETEIYKTTGKKLHEFFDVIVGTSTGGIQAIGLGMGLEATELKELYQTETRQIFKQNGWLQWLFGGLLGPTYSTDGLKKTIQKHMGNKTLSDVKTHVAVTVYDDESERTHLLTNQLPNSDSIDYTRTELPAGKLNIIDAIEATAAAPTYFAKKGISEGELLNDTLLRKTVHHYVDGGISANDPAILAKAFAQRLLKQDVFDQSYNGEIQLISIGTGREQPTIFNSKMGIFGFGNPSNIPSYFMNGSEAATHAALVTEMEEGENYFHLQFGLPHKIPLDTVDSQVLNLVAQKAYEATKTDYFKNMITVLCEKSISEILTPPVQGKPSHFSSMQAPFVSLIPLDSPPQAIEVAA